LFTITVMADIYCNNCGKQGHTFQNCRMPIASFGVVLFRTVAGARQYLMIRRKDTLGYIDFMRGKYSVTNKPYIMNMVKQMTGAEKQRLRELSFPEAMARSARAPYGPEERASRDKFNTLVTGAVSCGEEYTLASMLDESDARFPRWTEPEWGFPKGRRNYRERDYECALREFEEETGYSRDLVRNISNVLPFDEVFTGSNYRSYKHKYYLMYISPADSAKSSGFEEAEVSSMRWMSYDECMTCIRPYNTEKKRMLTNIERMLSNFRLHE
jgi:8-oxo-dGTP pyrophosphatase MutT (NUDIX family)